MTSPSKARARVAVASMPGKARALKPSLGRMPGLRLFTPNGLDTDALGTFTGERPRSQSPRATVERKARLALEADGADSAVRTGGSFGPDPVLAVVPLHQEGITWVDAREGWCVLEGIATRATNFAYI